MTCNIIIDIEKPITFYKDDIEIISYSYQIEETNKFSSKSIIDLLK